MNSIEEIQAHFNGSTKPLSANLYTKSKRNPERIEVARVMVLGFDNDAITVGHRSALNYEDLFEAQFVSATGSFSSEFGTLSEIADDATPQEEWSCGRIKKPKSDASLARLNFERSRDIRTIATLVSNIRVSEDIAVVLVTLGEFRTKYFGDTEVKEEYHPTFEFEQRAAAVVPVVTEDHFNLPLDLPISEPEPEPSAPVEFHEEPDPIAEAPEEVVPEQPEVVEASAPVEELETVDEPEPIAEAPVEYAPDSNIDYIAALAIEEPLTSIDESIEIIEPEPEELVYADPEPELIDFETPEAEVETLGEIPEPESGDDFFGFLNSLESDSNDSADSIEVPTPAPAVDHSFEATSYEVDSGDDLDTIEDVSPIENELPAEEVHWPSQNLPMVGSETTVDLGDFANIFDMEDESDDVPAPVPAASVENLEDKWNALIDPEPEVSVSNSIPPARTGSFMDFAQGLPDREVDSVLASLQPVSQDSPSDSESVETPDDDFSWLLEDDDEPQSPTVSAIDKFL